MDQRKSIFFEVQIRDQTVATAEKQVSTNLPHPNQSNKPLQERGSVVIKLSEVTVGKV